MGQEDFQSAVHQTKHISESPSEGPLWADFYFTFVLYNTLSHAFLFTTLYFCDSLFTQNLKITSWNISAIPLSSSFLHICPSFADPSPWSIQSKSGPCSLLPPPSLSLQEKYLKAPKARQKWRLSGKASMMKSSNISGASGTVQQKFPGHSRVQSMPYLHQYFIILYNSMFLTLMPRKFFSWSQRDEAFFCCEHSTVHTVSPSTIEEGRAASKSPH